MTMGDRLKQLRLDSDKTQLDVCKSLNIEQSTLANYESDKRKPKLDILIDIAKFYHTSTDFILGLTDSSESEKPSSDKQIANIDGTDFLTTIFSKLSYEKQKQLLRYALSLDEEGNLESVAANSSDQFKQAK